VLKLGIPADVLVNINFPDCLPGDVAGMAVCAQGKRDQELLRIDPRVDGRGNPYFWVAFERQMGDTRPGTDMRALAEKKIAVTPLRLDLTDEPFMTLLAGKLD
jgi:5'-nucleotidase